MRRVVSRRVDALRQIDGWGAAVAAVAVLRDGEVLATRGPRDVVLRWASITKPLAALAALIAAEEGVIDLDDAAGPEGSTIRHLLAHASGLPFDGSNADRGARAAADLLEHGHRAARRPRSSGAAEMPFGDYLRAAVIEPLGMSAELRGSPAAGNPRHARRPDRVRARARLADARRTGDPCRDDGGAVPRPRRRPAGHRPLRAERLGPRRRAPRREAAALDRDAQLAAHVRPLRRQRDVPLGRPRARTSPAPASPTASSTRGRSRRGRGSPTRSSRRPREGLGRRRRRDGARRRARDRPARPRRHGLRAVRARAHARLEPRLVAHLPAVVHGGALDPARAARVRAVARARAGVGDGRCWSSAGSSTSSPTRRCAPGLSRPPAFPSRSSRRRRRSSASASRTTTRTR